MSERVNESEAAAQIPARGKLNLDHIAHFVPHIDAASAALEKLGFTLTPFSAQSHRLQPEGPLVAAGTGNRCVMLRHGYLEFLTPTADTPVANQLRAAIMRYVGVHLIAFGTAAPDLDHARLAKGGFDPLAPVALQRQITTENGEDTARFTVVRVAPGSMAEGRIQFVQQHTPHLLWQARWLAHPNRATGLAGVVICTADPQETARRYANFSGLQPQAAGQAWRLDTARGYLLFADTDTLKRHLGVAPPALPWIAGYVLQSSDIEASGDYLRGASFEGDVLDGRRLLVKLPAALGGVIIFEPPESGALFFD